MFQSAETTCLTQAALNSYRLHFKLHGVEERVIAAGIKAQDILAWAKSFRAEVVDVSTSSSAQRCVVAEGVIRIRVAGIDHGRSRVIANEF